LGSAEDIVRLVKEAKEHQEPKVVQTKKFGLPMALFEMAERIGLRDIINKVVPGNIQGISVGDFILIAAINRVGNHDSKARIGRWYRRTALGRFQKIREKKLSSRSFWRAFDRIISEKSIKEAKAEKGYEPNEKIDIDELSEIIDDSKIKEIEKEIWKSLLKKYKFLLDIVLYDTTNFYTYHSEDTGNSLAQFGKRKEGKDHKRLIGLQLGILKDLGIPIFYNVYSGNYHDVSMFPTAISTLVERYHEVTNGTKGLVLVFDKGNNSARNFRLLKEQGISIHFVGSLVPSHHPDLMRIPLEDYTESYDKLKVYRTQKVVFETKKTIVITYNESLAKRQEHKFEHQMKKVMKEAKQFFETIMDEPTELVEAQMKAFLKSKKIGTSQALRFYSVKVWHNGWINKIQIRRKPYEVKRKKATFGKTILFTNLHNESSASIISYYRSAHQIEDAFHHLKDRDLVSYYPAYHWTDSKIRIHAFVCVIALLLIKLLLFIAKQGGLEMSTKVLIEELEDINLVIMVYPDRKVVQKVSHMSSIQKKLFDLFGLGNIHDICLNITLTPFLA